MIVRERILAQMGNLASESKWQDLLNDIMTELFQIRPTNPYLFLQKKMYLITATQVTQAEDGQLQDKPVPPLTHHTLQQPRNRPSRIKSSVSALRSSSTPKSKVAPSSFRSIDHAVGECDSPGGGAAKEGVICEAARPTARPRNIQHFIVFQHSLPDGDLQGSDVGSDGGGEAPCRPQDRLEQEYIFPVDQHSKRTILNVFGGVYRTKQLGLELQSNDIFRGIASQICERISM